jgi:DNA-binding MarR family transcriptional regulator
MAPRTTAKTTKRKKAEPEAPNYLRLDDQLCFPLYLAARLMVGAYRPLLEELGLTYPQYLVLMALWETDGMSVNVLGERLYLDSGTLTPLLKRMEKQGLVTRKRSRDDDRVVENWLTESARTLKKRANDVPVQMLCNAHLDLDDVLRMKGVLEGLVARLLPLQDAAGTET